MMRMNLSLQLLLSAKENHIAPSPAAARSTTSQAIKKDQPTFAGGQALSQAERPIFQSRRTNLTRSTLPELVLVPLLIVGSPRDRAARPGEWVTNTDIRKAICWIAIALPDTTACPRKICIWSRLLCLRRKVGGTEIQDRIGLAGPPRTNTTAACWVDKVVARNIISD